MATGGDRTFQRGPEKTWEKSAPSQIILNSIFAALSAVLVTLVISDSLPADLKYWETKFKFAELLLALFSFFLFAMSAEGTTNAYDEKDVRKYVYYLLFYNLGVVFIGFALAIFVGAHFVEHLGHFLRTNVYTLSQRAAQNIIVAIYVPMFVALQWNWLRDAHWLCCSSDAEFHRYLQELEDEVQPQPDPTCLMKLFYRRRNL
jgi:MFS family permease